MAGHGPSHHGPIRRGDRDRLSGVPAGDRPFRREASAIRWRIQFQSHELDKAQLSLDDVSLRMGDKGQEATLAIQLRRSGFDEILRKAVHSSFVQESYGTPENWRASLSDSPVRLQWDPDHNPSGTKQERRAIQLGLSGDMLHRYAEEWIVGVEDIAEFIDDQRKCALSRDFRELWTPMEEVMEITDMAVATRLGIDRHQTKSNP
jgi:hypothetical protein